MRKLPIGIQTFSEIIEEGYAYVDKTGIAAHMACNGKYYFLSRPRRFGKSLFISTLHALFEGRKELFAGLAAEKEWDWGRKYTVFKISFSGVARNVPDMKRDIANILKENAERLNLEYQDGDDIGGCFRGLIKGAFRTHGGKVVILVDEYDKPILDNLDQVEVALEAREILKDLYTTIKECDEYIRFAFLTGVSKFAKVSIFSGLNNLEDITLREEYATICGYTEGDLERVFGMHLQGADMARVREWYNGYCFLGEPVYNPFDILLFIRNGFKFNNYWFSTGTPTFLTKLIQRHNYFVPRLQNLRVGSALIDSFDIERLQLEPILFQAGYLTIDKVYETRRGGYEYKLKFPNKEVTLSFHDVLIDYLTDQTAEKGIFQDRLYEALENGSVESFGEVLKSLFASIPYNNYVNSTISSYEGYYASVIYAYLASLGLDMVAEDVTNRGRIDLTVKCGSNIYILEFKVEGRGSALEQLRQKKYHEKYMAEERDIYLVGIEFSSEKKNISVFEWEKV